MLDKMLHMGSLKEKLGEVHVLTTKKQYDDPDVENIAGITIHRCFFLSSYTKKNILQLLSTNPILAVRALIKKMPEFYERYILKSDGVIKPDVKNVLTKKLKQLHAEAYDVIIPVCGYYETASATMKYLERHSAKMVVYQVDPCATNRLFVDDPFNRAAKLEQMLCEKAAAIITTPVLYRYLCETYPESIIAKSHAMEFPNVDPYPVDTPTKHDEEYRCVFAGSIYPFARDPKYTISVFSLLKNTAIKLHFIGAAKAELSPPAAIGTTKERFLFHGSLPLEQARKAIQSADVLVNIGNIMTNQVPSKIFEYISACKPIINICANPDCPSIAYLEKYPLALSVVEGVGTPAEHAEKIEQFILKYAGQSVDKQIVTQQFKECTADYCADVMYRVIKNVLEEGNVKHG